MAGRGQARDDRERFQSRQELSVALAGLPSPASVTLDLSRAASSAVTMLRAMPSIRIDSGAGAAPAAVTAIRLQPQRIEIEVVSAPPVLVITLQVACDGPFLFGWLHVPEETFATIATSVERLRIVGPGYWAVPVWEPARPPGGAPVLAEEVPVITHQRQTARIAPERVAETAQAGRSDKADKP